MQMKAGNMALQNGFSKANSDSVSVVKRVNNRRSGT